VDNDSVQQRVDAASQQAVDVAQANLSEAVQVLSTVREQIGRHST
jgi:hypothetical protein